MGVTPVAEPAEGAELVEERFVEVERGQVEHPPISAAHVEWCVDPLRREAVVAGSAGAGHAGPGGDHVAPRRFGSMASG